MDRLVKGYWNTLGRNEVTLLSHRLSDYRGNSGITEPFFLHQHS